MGLLNSAVGVGVKTGRKTVFKVVESSGQTLSDLKNGESGDALKAVHSIKHSKTE